MILFGWRTILLAAALTAAIAWPYQMARAEPRLALVIGNSNYGGDLGTLPNPVNDAALMEKSLRAVGFEVVKLTDADQKALKRGISDFGRRLNELGPEATGLFFYAGHGLQVGGTNYLVPVNADIRGEADVDLEAVSADAVLSQMEFANARVNIVILDACRNNPLARSFRSTVRGLAKMDAPRGSFIAYSTAPGDVAADGAGTNSPYTAALAAAIRTPGKGIEEMFRDVRGEVLQKTGEAQTPWESSSLTAPFYFAEAKVAKEGDATFNTASAETGTDVDSTTRGTQQVASVDPKAVEMTFWESIKDSKDPADYESYLAKYPNGDYAPIANNRLKNLKATSIAPGQPAEQPAEQVVAVDPGASIVATQQMLYMKSKGNVRSAPNKNGPVLVQLPKNAELNVTGHTADGAWWRVVLEGGNVGYVHNSLTVNQPVVAPVPAAVAQPQPQPDTSASAAPAVNESGANESYAAAPAMADSGTTTQATVTTVEPDTSAQVGAALGGFLSGFAGGQGGGTIQISPSAPQQRQQVVTPPDPGAADQAIVAQLRSGNASGALKSANNAQTKDPGFWSKAAMVAFSANRRADLASNMARRALQENPGYLYGWLFVALAEGANGAGSAQTGLADFGQNAWPAPIAELMTGQRSADSLLVVAQQGGARALCEAGFYGAVHLKATGDAAGAAKLLKAGMASAKSCLEGAATLKLR